jgi:alkanesulfonate monooxygenase SsuD/methylene tetrahydromethanopterin reductase-like flavin-dependent oxidoreductase (luciferase family)
LSIFFADTYAGAPPSNFIKKSDRKVFFSNLLTVHDNYEGKADASFKGGHAAGQLDPVVMVFAMASVTKSDSFGLTASTTYIPVRL